MTDLTRPPYTAVDRSLRRMHGVARRVVAQRRHLVIASFPPDWPGAFPDDYTPGPLMACGAELAGELEMDPESRVTCPRCRRLARQDNVSLPGETDDEQESDHRAASTTPRRNP